MPGLSLLPAVLPFRLPFFLRFLPSLRPSTYDGPSRRDGKELKRERGHRATRGWRLASSAYYRAEGFVAARQLGARHCSHDGRRSAQCWLLVRSRWPRIARQRCHRFRDRGIEIRHFVATRNTQRPAPTGVYWAAKPSMEARRLTSSQLYIFQLTINQPLVVSVRKSSAK